MAIQSNNVKNIQFLRNGSLFNDRAAALSGLQTAKGDGADGSAILARYGSGANVKTLVGFVWTDGTSKTITIFDVEGASADVDALRTEINNKLGNGVGSGASETVTAQLTALSGTADASSAETSVAGAKAYAKDYTDEQIGNLEYTGVTTGAAVVVTNVQETDGVVSASTANVGTLTLDGYSKGSDSGAVATADTINSAIGKLENQIDAAKDAATAAIDALDYTDSAVTGSYVSKVDETNGVISVTRVALPDLTEVHEAGKPIIAVSETKGQVAASAGTIDAQYVDVTGFTATDVQGVLEEIDTAYKAGDSAIVGDATSSGNTLGKLEDRIEALDADAKEYHIVKTTTDLPAEIKERYSLVDAAGNVSGDTIDVPVDSHIVSIDYSGSTQKLYYTYIDVSGQTRTTEVDMSELVLETEFASGVTVTDHVAHGVVDSTSEKDSNNAAFLTVGEDGFKISGIKDEIDRKINALDASVSGNSAHINVVVDEVDGKLTAVTVTESGLATSDAIEELSAKTVTEIDSSNNSISAETAATSDGTVKYDLTTDASKIKMSGYTAVTSGVVADSQSVTEAIAALEGAFIDNEETVAAALNDLDTTKAEASDLTAEIAARKAVDGVSGDAYSADTNAHYISGATSLYGADQALDTALNGVDGRVAAVEGAYLSGVTVNGETATVADHVATVTIDGGDVALSENYVKAQSAEAVATGDTVDVAIGKLEKKIDDATAGGLQGVDAGSGVTVSNVANNRQTINVKLADPANVSGIEANALAFDSTAQGLYLDTIDAGLY